MTQEDKKLLLKDIAARLPYATKVFYEYVDDLDKKTYGYSLTLNTWCIDEFDADKAVVKPYLRPMSSMTEEERNELFYYDNAVQRTDFFYSHHIDCRFMIEKGLALEAPKGMYNLEKK